jgi:threonine/homoserine/homoserine lactone efflux protein
VILAFVFAFVASFLGSLPPGPSNLAVLHMALNKHSRAATWMALGASIMELPYSYLAVLAIQYVSAYQSIHIYLEVAAIVILLSVGTYILLFQKGKDIEAEDAREKWSLHPLWKGMLVAAFNPMLVGFWLVLSQLGVSWKCMNVHDPYEKAGFVLGTALGAFALLMVVVMFTNKIKQYAKPRAIFYLNRAIGGLFIVLGILQAVKSYLS